MMQLRGAAVLKINKSVLSLRRRLSSLSTTLLAFAAEPRRLQHDRLRARRSTANPPTADSAVDRFVQTDIRTDGHPTFT